MDEAILTAFGRLNFPTDEIAACLANGDFAASVEASINEGRARGISGTPTFFINGVAFVGAQPYETFQAALQQAQDGTLQAPPTRVPDNPVAAIPTPASIEPRMLTALGNPDAPVTIIEYSDYQCPFCRRHMLETMPQLKTNFIDTGRVYYVFKDMPLASLHPLAYRLHEAALCVGQEGGTAVYWQAHDLFFNNAEAFQQKALADMDTAILSQLAQADLPDVSACLASGENSAAVEADVAEGAALGVRGTPAFFINGYPVNGAQPYELFDYAIGLAEAGELASAYQQAGPRDGKAQATATAQAAQPVNVPLGDEPFKGSPDAPITIVEYSDYQCPFCLRHFQQTMPQFQSYIDAGQVRYLFKDFPLHTIHPQAQKAHEAARCAGELGGNETYWQMHDLLFARQEEWASVAVPQHVAVFKQLADEANLPTADFAECLDSGRYEEAVNEELNEGIELGVRGTPAFFINGNFVNGAQPFSVFQQAIEQLLREQ